MCLGSPPSPPPMPEIKMPEPPPPIPAAPVSVTSPSGAAKVRATKSQRSSLRNAQRGSGALKTGPVGGSAGLTIGK